jgi:biotin operon repressor/predicted phosphodiesterase
MSGLSDQARAVLARLQDAPADKDALADHVGVAASTVRDHISTLRDEGYDIEYSYTHQQYHFEEQPRTQPEDISYDAVADALEGGIKLPALCSEFATDREVIETVLSDLEGEGYDISEREADGTRVVYLPTDVDRRYRLGTDGTELTIGLLSDTHLGSAAEHLDALHEYYDMLADRGISRVFHCGDISDGWKVHTGHLNEIKDEAAGWGNLKRYVINNYPRRDGVTTYFIEGNHDNKFYNRNNIRFGRLIANQREDLKYCGNSQATYVIDQQTGADLETIHPSGGKPYTTGYRLQTLYRERSVTDRPSIAGVGHLHGSMYAETEGVKGLYAGAWKGTTTYGKRKGHQAKIGGWVLDLTFGDDGVRRLIPEWHGWPEQESANRYDIEDLE